VTGRRFKIAGRGSVQERRPGQRRIVIQFDDETFEEIRQRAAKHQQSFAASVRDLVEFGLWEEEQEANR
jgi:hypothetical protein